MKHLLPFLLAVAACVPKGKHEILEVQLEATQIALSERTAKATIDVNALEQEIVRLQDEIAQRQRQLDDLAARGTLRDEALATSTADLGALAAELASVRATLADREAQLLRLRKGKAVPEPVTVPVTDADARIAAALEAQREADIDASSAADARAADADAFRELVDEGHAELLTRGPSTVLRIPTRLLFQEGFTTLSPRGEAVLAEVAAGLARVPGRVVTIEGHTDTAAVHTADFPSNWDRGFSRAVAVLRALEQAPATFSVASFAGTRPIADDTTPEGRDANQRVELVLALDPDLPASYAPTQAEGPSQ